MDVINNADSINRKIFEIDDYIEQLEGAATDKAQAISTLKRRIAITILKIKNGLITDFVDTETGETVKIPSNLAQNLIPKIAEGLCWEEELNNVKAEAEYKSLVVKIEATRAQLNGYQSIFKVIQ